MEDRYSARNVRLFAIKWNVGFIIIVSIGALAFLSQGLWAVSAIMSAAIAYSIYVLTDDLIKLRKGIDSD